MSTPATAAAPTRVAIVTLGCGRNDVDSDQLAGLFALAGHEVVDDAEDADAVLVNTCTFIAPAKQESVDTVLAACDLKQPGDDGSQPRTRAVLVVGCMAQRYPDELAEAIPEADAVVGFAGYPQLPDLVDRVLAGQAVPRVLATEAHPGARPADAAGRAPAAVPTTRRRDLPLLVGGPVDVAEAPPVQLPPTPQDALDRIPASGPPGFQAQGPLRRHDGGPWAYLKIASGCDRVCTFCAIPSFRGRFRSRPVDEVLTEARWLVEQGARELVLVSENTTSYGKDLEGGRRNQVTLLERLGAVDGLERVRLLYLQPAELQAPLVEAIAGMDHVASYFDLSLQHASGPVVQAMARSGDAASFLALVERVRELDPAAAFRSNMILGFPGETEHDVEVLEQFLVDARLDWVGLFPFSVEDGTPSATFPDQVDAAEAAARVDRVGRVQAVVADERARAQVGRRLRVIVDRPHPANDGGAGAVARSYREAPDTDGEIRLVSPDGRPADVPPGRVLEVDVVDHEGVDLVARPVTADVTKAR